MSGPASPQAPLVRRLGLLDVTLIVMGGIVGSGIFVNPSVVAQRTGDATATLAAWLVGGLIAIAGALVAAELGARRPLAGGQYAYFREAFHPAAGFVYAWGLLLLIQTGGMAASAMTFARYVRELGHVPLSEGVLAGTVMLLLTVINAFGVRMGANTQNTLMLLKIAAIVLVVAAGLAVAWGGGAAPLPAATGAAALSSSANSTPPAGFGAAMVPVLFAYGGWQTAAFVSGEVRDPERNLPRGMLLGVAGVVLLYMAVNFACVRVLGADGLAATPAPAAQVMRLAFGEVGARVLALGVAASTLGFLSQAMLTAPRVYWAMAADGLFFKSVARVHPRTHAPVVAVALQGGAATLLALTGEYGRILDTVVSADWIFYGLSAVALFVFRRRDRAAGRPDAGSSAHPWATVAFLAASGWIVWQALAHDLRNGLIGLGLLIAGLPIYALWRRSRTA